jgi:hypothetical protein
MKGDNKMNYYLSTEKIRKIKRDFLNLPLDSPEEADRFFEKYGIGNTLFVVNKPRIRFIYYEQLLFLIRNINKEKYEIIHKGIPFYYLAWLSFDLGNFNAFLFYIDASISEDITNHSIDWFNSPATKMLTLEDSSIQPASRTIQEIKLTLESQLARFNLISEKDPLCLENLSRNFVKKMLLDKNQRLIISAFFVFLLNYGQLLNEIVLQGRKSSSTAQIITFLFSGALIFESLLKIKYPFKNDGVTPVSTLKDIFNSTAYITDSYPSISHGRFTLEDAIQNSYKDQTIETAFETTYLIRNTTGHNLIWDGSNANNNFSSLVDQEVNALLYFIQKEFCP